MELIWTTADYALIISLASAFISFVGLAWNVWSKFIFPKPRLEVNIGHTIAVGPVYAKIPDAVSVTAINHGPTELTLTHLVGWVYQGYFSKSKRAVLQVFDDYPSSSNSTLGGSGGLPIRLRVGDNHTVYLPTAPKIYQKVRNMGWRDGFGREHCANIRGKRTIKKFSEE